MSTIKRSRTARSKSKSHQIEEADKWPLKASSYKLEQPISKGQYGLCWRAHCHDTSSPHHKRQVSIKIISIAQFPHEGIEELDNEIKISSQCNHKHVMKYYVSFVNDSELWLVMPYVSRGTLRTNLRQKFPTGIKDEVLIASILYQVVQAITYFHQKGYIHRDIKADNIMVHETGQLFVGNFFQSSNNSSEKEFIGSPPWMAPEVMAQKEAYTNKADIWSLGIMILELINGKAPHESKSSVQLVQSVINDSAPEVNKYETIWSKEFRALVASFLKKDAKARENVGSVLNKHEQFFKQQEGSEYILQELLKDNKAPEIENDVIAAGNHYLNLKYQRLARKNSVSFGNKMLDIGSKKKKIQWNFNTTLEDQQLAESTKSEENESENLQQTESLDDDSINDESRVHLKDHSITESQTMKKKTASVIEHHNPAILLDQSYQSLLEDHESFRSELKQSQRSNVIMETIDILNDKAKISQSFNHSASKQSNFEVLDQVKILQTEDERENMSMRRNNFESYNQASVVQQQYVETNNKTNESQDQVFTLGRSDSPDHYNKKTDFTSNINLQQSSPLTKENSKKLPTEIPLNIKSQSSSRLNHSLLEPERALLQELQTPQQRSDEQKNGRPELIYKDHQEGKLNQSHQHINQSQGVIHKKNMSSYKHTESQHSDNIQYHNQSFASNRNIIEEQQSKIMDDEDEPELDSDEELNDE